MTSFYISQVSQISHREEDQDQSFHPFLFPGNSSSNSKQLPPILLQNLEDHTPNTQEIERQLKSRDYTTNQAAYYHYVREGDQDQTPWCSSPSKMKKIVRPMQNSDQNTAHKGRRMKNDLHDQKQRNHESISESSVHGSFVKACSACSTTKTPLWRSGPRGPKSLCNACGIRQMKARRAMKVVTANAGGGGRQSVAVSNAGKDEDLDGDRSVPFKKRCKFTAVDAAQRKLCFDEIVISLKKSSTFHRVFPQDEKEAAILLMALSSRSL